MHKTGDRAKRFAQRRSAVVRRAMRDCKTDTLFITNGPDIRYLSGCTEGGSALLFGHKWAVIFAVRMFEYSVPKESPGCEVRVIEKSLYVDDRPVVVEFRVDVSGYGLTNNDEFTLSVIPVSGPVLVLMRTIPARILTLMELG